MLICDSPCNIKNDPKVTVKWLSVGLRSSKICDVGLNAGGSLFRLGCDSDDYGCIC